MGNILRPLTEKNEQIARSYLRSRLESDEIRCCSICNETKSIKFFRGRIIKHIDSLQITFSNRCIQCNKTKPHTNSKSNSLYKNAHKYMKQFKYSNLCLNDLKLLLGCQCYYCGNLYQKMELDKKDMSKDFIKGNVISICCMCKVIKSNMTNEAWKYILPHIREASRLGLFKTEK